METEPIKIKVYEPLMNVDERKKVLPKNLPKPPFRAVFLASTMGGKSNLIKNFVYNFYKNYFQEIYIVCASADDCEEYERLAEKTYYNKWNSKKGRLYKSKREPMSKKVSVIRDVKAQEIADLYRDIEDEMKETGKRKRILMVFDDYVVENIFKKGMNATILDKLYTAGRHIGLSVIIATQKYKMLNPNLRSTNLSHLVMFSGLNDSELKQVATEHSGSMTEEDFIRIYRENTTQPYSFVVVNTKEGVKKKFQNKDFEYILEKT